MIYNNVDFETYFKHYPDENGYFGKYGGAYISEELQVAMKDINEAYQTICKSRRFISELRPLKVRLITSRRKRNSWTVLVRFQSPRHIFSALP